MRGSSLCDGKAGKKVSRKWTEEEVVALVAAINAVPASHPLNWAEIAKLIPERTGKQCREKYKNDLRPEISKAAWIPSEEFILARAHSEVGNQWAEIAKFLPGRSENSIKNHWNATLRSKAEAKSRTLLWTYGRLVYQQGGTTSLRTFREAVRAYQRIPDAEPLCCIEVPGFNLGGAGLPGGQTVDYDAIDAAGLLLESNHAVTPSLSPYQPGSARKLAAHMLSRFAQESGNDCSLSGKHCLGIVIS
ncbi:uncharacterized protein HaLaN_02951 [Haematococcus lacustris]|uniref:Uncharacterized protein n=1 Tax=Haematococcus lacustris TaxID=44745 RepID=A0A699YF31_HAELA|nr:uncharacterized protein HaLaN_02951 [Haematococcus lacustris]